MMKVEAMFIGGEVHATRGAITEHSQEEILGMLQRHFMCDWGDLDEEDKIANIGALENGDRILSSYGDCYVITEADRSYTTVMLKSEY